MDTNIQHHTQTQQRLPSEMDPPVSPEARSLLSGPEDQRDPEQETGNRIRLQHIQNLKVRTFDL